MKEREEEGEEKRGMSRPEWGDRPTAEPKKTLETTGMHECTHHTLIRARPDPPWKKSHEDSHRGAYVLCIIFVIVALFIMQEGGRVLNMYVGFRSLPESARRGDAVRAVFQVR